MKKVIYLILIAFFATNIYSQIPQTISWQGILQDADAKNLSGTYSLTVKLFDVASGGAALWSESHSNVAIADGLVNLTLGSVTPFGVNFDDEYWLEITIDSGTPLQRIKLSSVPYSLYSAKTNSVIQNDSLVLKDALGVTRMVLNPNTGTFKMMNNDTVWYDIVINSPASSTVKNADGTTTVTSNGGDNITVYRADGNIESEYAKSSITMFDEKQIREEKISYNDNNTPYITNVKETTIDELGEPWIMEKTTIFDADGNEILNELYVFAKGESKRVYGLTNDEILFEFKLLGGNEPEVKQSITKNNVEIASTKYREHNGKGQVITKGEHNVVGEQYISENNWVSGNSYIAGNQNVHGNQFVVGNLNVAGTKNFMIDHPDDPENKYLYHSCIESNEVLNKYSGVTTTDEHGNAIVELPEYFEKINRNFRYQLTVIGQFAQAIISREIIGNVFEISTNIPNVKVSWEITAERYDDYMKKNPFKHVKSKNEVQKIDYFYINK